MGREARREKDRKRDNFEMLEASRDRLQLEEDKRRAARERERWTKLREKESIVEDETLERRAKLHKEYLLQWKVSLHKKTLRAKEQEKRDVKRDKKITDKEDLRLRKL